MTQAPSAALLAGVTSLPEERQPGVSEGLPVADFALERFKNRDHGDPRLAARDSGRQFVSAIRHDRERSGSYYQSGGSRSR